MIPDYWTVREALAVYEFIDEIREEIWNRYGLQLQEQMQEEMITGPEVIDDDIEF
ncbi:MAG: hypothetical protein RPV21_03580 [Candidatus Sedimenticola sp. (ex Thyasira tokunagai)]